MSAGTKASLHSLSLPHYHQTTTSNSPTRQHQSTASISPFPHIHISNTQNGHPSLYVALRLAFLRERSGCTGRHSDGGPNLLIEAIGLSLISSMQTSLPLSPRPLPSAPPSTTPSHSPFSVPSLAMPTAAHRVPTPRRSTSTARRPLPPLHHGVALCSALPSSHMASVL